MTRYTPQDIQAVNEAIPFEPIHFVEKPDVIESNDDEAWRAWDRAVEQIAREAACS